jgi:hypothetical protein
VRELQAGLWHWQAPHPHWTPGERWPQEVSSYAIDEGARLLLFDRCPCRTSSLSLRPTARRWWCSPRRGTNATRRAWSSASACRCSCRRPTPRTTSCGKYGIVPEQAGGGSPDVAWLLAGDGGEAHLYAAGDRLPIGIEAFPGREQNDLVLWIESRRAVVAGDALQDFGRGLEIRQESLTKGVTREQVVEGLRPLLALPVEVVLPAHGAPTDRAALERALS